MRYHTPCYQPDCTFARRAPLSAAQAFQQVSLTSTADMKMQTVETRQLNQDKVSNQAPEGKQT